MSGVRRMCNSRKGQYIGLKPEYCPTKSEFLTIETTLTMYEWCRVLFFGGLIKVPDITDSLFGI